MELPDWMPAVAPPSTGPNVASQQRVVGHQFSSDHAFVQAPLGPQCEPWKAAGPMGPVFPPGASVTPHPFFPQASPLQQAVVGAVMNQISENIDASQIQSVFPSYIHTLREYFSVSHSYVASRLLSLFFPFSWLRRPQNLNLESTRKTSRAGDFMVPESGNSETLADSIRVDLYVPAMAFITYILLVGLTRGTFDDFHPELLTSTASFALVILFLEVLSAKAGFYLCGRDGIPVLDLLAYSGYKFVSLVVIVFTGLVASKVDALYWVVFIYCSSTLSWWTYQAMRQSGPDSHQPSQDWGVTVLPKAPMYLTFALAVLQIPLCWLLTPSWRVKAGHF